MSSAREDILSKLQQSRRDAVALPDVWHSEATAAPDLGWHDFAEALRESHGEFHGPIPQNRLQDFLDQQLGEDYATTTEGDNWLGKGGESLSREQLDGVQWMVGVARYAIARNGAVLVTHEEAPVRMEMLLSEGLVILVREEALLQDLDQLYAAVTPSPESYLSLVCGPSKTADIEQTLVKGAHGPRRMLVVSVSAH